ncbi:MAG: helix-turn-helix domain-containing protein, partial [Pseudomonadota bacterium]
QKRALLTQEKILDALEALLEAQEFEAISIADLAAQAQVAVGSVYSYFKDKEALLPALLDRQLERVEERLREFRERGTVDGWPTDQAAIPSLYDAIEHSVAGALKQIDATLGVRRALLTYRRLNPSLEVPLAKTQAEEALKAMVAQLELYRDEIPHADIQEAAKMVNYFVNIVFLDRIVFINSPVQDSIRPSDDMLIETYSQMIYRYLTQS